MWQLYSLGALFVSATENVIDKASLVKNIAVDFFVASFLRAILFSIVTIAIGLTGVLGGIKFSFHWSIFLLAPIGVFSSLFYTYLLQKVEITTTTAASYLAPIIFLFIDSTILHIGISFNVVVGIILLVIGGISFSVNAQTRRFKPEISWLVWGMFAFNIFWTGCEAYLFKYLNTTYDVNGVSFFASLWIMISVCLFLILCFKGRFKLLFQKPSQLYLKQAFLSKTCDAVSTVLWAQALVFATVAQVSAFDALFPLILFVLVVIAQQVFGLKLNEKLDTKNFVWKIGATICLVAGSFLVG